MASDGKYAPLTRYLAQLPADQQEVVLTLAELEALLGERLPPTAYYESFWLGSARATWSGLGFTAHRRVRPFTVVFTRRQPFP